MLKDWCLSHRPYRSSVMFLQYIIIYVMQILVKVWSSISIFWYPKFVNAICQLTVLWLLPSHLISQNQVFHLYTGYFTDYFLGDENIALNEDGSRSLFAVNDDFTDYGSFFLGAGYEFFRTERLGLHAGIELALKRKPITNRYRIQDSPFRDSTNYSINAFYVALPFTVSWSSQKRIEPILAIEPGVAFSRFERNDAMTSSGIPDRFRDIWRYNFGVAPGINMKLSKNIGLMIQGQYYLRNMLNDYSENKFRTVGWKAAISYQWDSN